MSTKCWAVRQRSRRRRKRLHKKIAAAHSKAAAMKVFVVVPALRHAEDELRREPSRNVSLLDARLRGHDEPALLRRFDREQFHVENQRCARADVRRWALIAVRQVRWAIQL